MLAFGCVGADERTATEAVVSSHKLHLDKVPAIFFQFSFETATL